MLLWPGSTGRYFSWQLSPAPVASLVGAFYVASAIVFGWAASFRSWTVQHGLCTSVLGLAAPTLVVTAMHGEVFDFGRWQAIAWVFLFGASVTSFAMLVLVRGRPEPSADDGPDLPGAARAALAVLAVVYGAVAVVLWVAPARGLAARPDRRRPHGSALRRRLGRVPRHDSPPRRRPPQPSGVPPPRRRAWWRSRSPASSPRSATSTSCVPLRRPSCSPPSPLLAGVGLSVQRAGRRVVVPTTRGGAVR